MLKNKIQKNKRRNIKDLIADLAQPVAARESRREGFRSIDTRAPLRHRRLSLCCKFQRRALSAIIMRSNNKKENNRN